MAEPPRGRRRAGIAHPGTLRVVLGDQCTPGLSALDGLDAAHDTVLMAEVMAECTYVRHHPIKIALVLSAMRHFAEALAGQGVRVAYTRLDDPANTQSLRGEVARAAARLRVGAIVATEPGEWRVLEDMRGWQDAAGVAVEIRDDTRFICRLQDFRAWAGGKRGLRMEFFYREMRRRTGLLMDGDAPEGGRWNYDAENRKRLPAGIRPPPVPRFEPDAITREVLALVAARFAGHFGRLDDFALPVTGSDAARALDDFIANRLPAFGDWQDAMAADEPHLFHSLISTSLNCGLLDPLESCRRAEAAWRAGDAPLNAVEGFIRQILGWREFVRGIYWLRMPEYGTRNGLAATRRLPDFYWTGQTRMACLRQVITQTQASAHAHHIQRLMVTGNFALLAGLDPDAVDEWYMIVFADAYQWVELPNTRGMALHADHGEVGSKPYAASGAYINRMSNYCAGCHYDVKDSTGPRACPFNALYWDFIARHAERFAGNMRMAMPLRTWERMDQGKRAALRARAAAFLGAMDAGETV
jgi:deoxyribodipyrimidine photolyase-related protein